MIHQTKTCGLVLVATFLVAVQTFGSAITWGTQGQTLFNADGSLLLDGNRSTTGYTTAGLIQLIYCGANGTYDGFTPSLTGTLIDDQVVSTAWVGKGATVVQDPDGRFVGGTYNDAAGVGAHYIIRFFDTASSNYANGTVPTTGHYGVFDSNFLVTADATQDFKIDTAQNAWQAVPEPGTLSLITIGAVCLSVASRRRQRK